MTKAFHALLLGKLQWAICIEPETPTATLAAVNFFDEIPAVFLHFSAANLFPPSAALSRWLYKANCQPFVIDFGCSNFLARSLAELFESLTINCALSANTCMAFQYMQGH